jgi:hypothetical protein
MVFKEMRIGRPTETDSVIEKPIKEPLFLLLFSTTHKLNIFPLRVNAKWVWPLLKMFRRVHACLKPI